MCMPIVKAQNAKMTTNGNYISIAPAKEQSKPTGKTFTDAKGIAYPVYITAKGKLFIIKDSKKTGKQYKSYLKL